MTAPMRYHYWNSLSPEQIMPFECPGGWVVDTAPCTEIKSCPPCCAQSSSTAITSHPSDDGVELARAVTAGEGTRGWVDSDFTLKAVPLPLTSSPIYSQLAWTPRENSYSNYAFSETWVLMQFTPSSYSSVSTIFTSRFEIYFPLPLLSKK